VCGGVDCSLLTLTSGVRVTNSHKFILGAGVCKSKLLWGCRRSSRQEGRAEGWTQILLNLSGVPRLPSWTEGRGVGGSQQCWRGWALCFGQHSLNVNSPSS
jgi:hypothetical protein